MRSSSKTPLLAGQHVVVLASQPVPAPVQPGGFTVVLANSVNCTPLSAANAAISWLLAGSCCPAINRTGV